MMYTLLSKFAIIPPEKQVVKIRKTEAGSDSDGEENDPSDVQTPAGRRPMPFYPQWPYKTPYGRRGILSSTLSSRAPYDV